MYLVVILYCLSLTLGRGFTISSDGYFLNITWEILTHGDVFCTFTCKLVVIYCESLAYMEVFSVLPRNVTGSDKCHRVFVVAQFDGQYWVMTMFGLFPMAKPMFLSQFQVENPHFKERKTPFCDILTSVCDIIIYFCISNFELYL